MADRYADPAGGNNPPYANWADAATNPQTIIDLAVAGDRNFYRNFGIIAAMLDIDTNSGDLINGYIQHIGCNAAGVVDGTRVIFDANGALNYCISNLFNQDYHLFENFEFTNAIFSGVRVAAGADHNRFVNCAFHGNGSHGFWGQYQGSWEEFYRCQFYNNAGDGYQLPGVACTFELCSFWGNGVNGLQIGIGRAYTKVIKCVFHDNGDNASHITCGNTAIVENNVIDGTNQANENGIFLNEDWCIINANRITNCNNGINFNGQLASYGHNYFANNTNDIINAGLAYPTPVDALADTNLLAQAQDWYNNVPTDDFNLQAGGVNSYTGDGDDVIDLGIGA